MYCLRLAFAAVECLGLSLVSHSWENRGPGKRCTKIADLLQEIVLLVSHCAHFIPFSATDEDDIDGLDCGVVGGGSSGAFTPSQVRFEDSCLWWWRVEVGPIIWERYY